MTSKPTLLTCRDVSVGYGETPVVHHVSLDFAPGAVTTLIGPNGSGKSTLVRAIAGLLPVASGDISLAGQPLHTLRPRERAQRIGFLPQDLIVPEHVTVRELVGHGRDPYRRWLDTWAREDADAVDRALRLTDTTGLADRPLDELSGGQRQRAWVALMLAQAPDILILDEPTTYLDIAHQLDALELLTTLAAQQRITIIMVLHDLTMAARFSDTILAMRDGRAIAHGPAAHVLAPQTLRSVFDIDAEITHSSDGQLVVVPRRRIPGGDTPPPDTTASTPSARG